MRTTVAFCLLLGFSVHAQNAADAPAPIVFFDIAGTESDPLVSFYSELFNWNIGQNGSFSAPVTSPLQGTIRQDPPETLFYIGVENITATLECVVERGGSIEYPRFEVPGTGPEARD